ncbi:MAG: hypothetical protein DWH78_05260 [Planctomycetota bacterium]|nr:MAG: hypothetical protein DWH78_05260 [Planctomycetota bacterium]
MDHKVLQTNQKVGLEFGRLTLVKEQVPDHRHGSDHQRLFHPEKLMFSTIPGERKRSSPQRLPFVFGELPVKHLTYGPNNRTLLCV